MDLNLILQTLGKFFPNTNFNDAIGKAQQAIQGTPNNLLGVSQTARSLGVTPDFIDKLYSRYGSSMQARTICSVLGTTPEALKADADKIIGGGQPAEIPSRPATSAKFPRLK